ncbi:MAG: lytic transglycosylase domain-containing protein [Burkholderiales bacterium]|nr:lytic transglycosylase domain-containing protein [Burkholderiales bacterium]
MLKQRQVGLIFDVFVRAVGAGRFSAAALPLTVLPLAAAIVAGTVALQRAPSLDDADAAGDEPAALQVPHASPALGAPTVAAALSAPRALAGLTGARSERPAKLPRMAREQRNIAEFVAQKYRVAIDDVVRIVDHAYHAARELRIDPYLVIAVMSIESSFNPNARSPQGAQGLMQVLTRVHADKFAQFGGVAAAFDPMANISVGSRILKEYLVRDGSVEAALKSYVGAALLPHDYGYGVKVLSERERIAAAAAGRPLPANAPVRLPAGTQAASAAAGAAAAASALSAAAESNNAAAPAAVRIVAPISGEPSQPKALPLPLPLPAAAGAERAGEALPYEAAPRDEPVLPNFSLDVTNFEPIAGIADPVTMF